MIGHVGRFSTQKNHLFLLDIFSEILKTRPDCVLLLVGSGELETACRERVAELGMESSVVFAGVRSDVPGLMSAMDLMIFPSLYEGMPNVIIEAQATGLKCLISDTITPEVGVTDLVFRESLKNDSTQWANRAVELLSNQAGERTAQKTLIEAGYDIQAVVLKFTKLAFRE